MARRAESESKRIAEATDYLRSFDAFCETIIRYNYDSAPSLWRGFFVRGTVRR